MSRYKTMNHAKCRICYHLISSVKFRRKLLEPIREDVLASFRMAEGLRSSDSPCCLAATITVFFV